MQDRIRKADKSIYGDVPKRNLRCRTKRPVDAKAAAEQRERLKGITARIRAEEQQLKDNKISPFWAGTAQKFDELKEIDKAIEKVVKEYGPTLKLLKET